MTDTLRPALEVAREFSEKFHGSRVDVVETSLLMLIESRDKAVREEIAAHMERGTLTGARHPIMAKAIRALSTDGGQ